ncbi:MAG: GAF domain-containing protein [bacterium]|nr:GAF domain-containing protein [bacterium]
MSKKQQPFPAKKIARVTDITMIILILFILAISAKAYLSGTMELFIVWAPLSIYIVIFYAYLVNVLQKQNEELESSNKELRQSIQKKHEFIYNISIQLRKPLHSIKHSLAFIIGDKNVALSNKRLLEQSERGIEQLEDVVSRLLDHSMITSGRTHLLMEQTDVKGLINEVVRETTHLAEAKQVSMETVVPDMQDIPIDKPRIHQAIKNLVLNAIKFSSVQSKILIQAKEDKNRIQIDVIDHGEGMSPQKLETIFEEFSREVSLPFSEMHGSGLGLPISQGIIEAHGGSIKVTSKQGEGSTFTVILPKETTALSLLEERRQMRKFLAAIPHLTELADQSILCEIQDNFTQTFGIPTIIVDNEGIPVTGCDAGNEFCRMIKSCPKGAERCKQFSVRVQTEALKDTRSKAYYCFAGLAHFSAPILVEHIHLGSIEIHGAQVFLPINPNKLKVIARDLGLNYDELLEKASSVPRFPEEKVYAAGELLYAIANTISSLCMHEHKLLHKIAELSTFSQIGRAITSNLDFDALLDMILYTTISVLEADGGSIMLMNENNELIIKVSYGLPNAILRETRVPVGKGISGYVAREKKPVILYHGMPDEYLAPLLRRGHLKTAMCVPLIVKGEVVGVFNLTRKSGELFSEESLSLFKTFCNQAAIALEEARLYASMEEKTKQLEAFTKIGEVTLSAVDMDVALSLIIEAVSKAMQTQLASIRLLDNTGENLINMVGYGLSDQYLKRGAIKVGESIAGNVVKTGECIAIENISHDDRIKDTSAAIKEGIVSLMSAPLISRDRVIGCITIYSKTQRTYTPEDMELFFGLASQAAVAIEYTKIFKTIRDGLSKTSIALSEAISAMDSYDKEQGEKKAEYAELIAREMNFPTVIVETIKMATLLHDIGKLAIPEKILQKPAALTKEEFETIKRHPLISEEILRKIELPWDVLSSIKQHHERIDGKGYPEGLTKEEISVEALIIEVVDAFYAMVSERPYRPAMSVKEATRVLQQEAGKQFSPEVVGSFLSVLRKKGMDVWEA